MKQFNQELPRNIEWSIDEFIQKKIYKRNRSVDKRVKKVAAFVMDGLETIYDVHVGYATKDFDVYKQGDFFVLNGNTRAEVWRRYPDLKTNRLLNVRVYPLSDEKTAYKLYKTFDSKHSVESTSDYITGFLRDKNYEPVSNRLRKGSISTILRVASWYTMSEDMKFLKYSDVEVKFNYFWEELKYLDQSGVLDKKKSSTKVVAALLMIGKKYGINNLLYQDLVNKLTYETLTESNMYSEDGVCHVFNTLYSRYTKEWKTDTFDSLVIRNDEDEMLMSRILYSLDCFMRGKLLKKTGRNLKSNVEFNNFWKHYLS
jgi:hypothetical protein